jgi:4-hydroxybenzoate polyprenyltransferase
MKIIVYIKLLRMHQWTKNLICFAGIIFGHHMNNIDFWLLSVKVFFYFSLLSSSIYVFNDIFDKKQDTKHPKKRKRPIASGDITIPNAIIIGLLCMFFGLTGSYMLGKSIFIIFLMYVINNILYNYFFKNVPILDVISISFGFIFRILSGIYVVNDMPTIWAILCTMFLALFLGFSKRRAELLSIKANDNYEQRSVLMNYDQKILDSLVNETSFGAIITYALFTVISGKNPSLIITLPIVYYAISYYKLQLFQNKYGEAPDIVLLNDKIIWICIVSWLITYIAIIISGIRIF